MQLSPAELTRRAFLGRAERGLGGIALLSLLKEAGLGGAASNVARAATPSPLRPAGRTTARSYI